MKQHAYFYSVYPFCLQTSYALYPSSKELCEQKHYHLIYLHSEDRLFFAQHSFLSNKLTQLQQQKKEECTKQWTSDALNNSIDPYTLQLHYPVLGSFQGTDVLEARGFWEFSTGSSTEWTTQQSHKSAMDFPLLSSPPTFQNTCEDNASLRSKVLQRALAANPLFFAPFAASLKDFVTGGSVGGRPTCCPSWMNHLCHAEESARNPCGVVPNCETLLLQGIGLESHDCNAMA